MSLTDKSEKFLLPPARQEFLFLRKGLKDKMIEIKNLTKIYPATNSNPAVKALEGINLTIKDGEIFGIIGLSGAGKSTLVRCINFLEKPTEGSVLINGKNLATMPPNEIRLRRQKIGMIFQNFNLLWSRTAAGNIAFPLEIAGYPASKIKERVQELLELVGLTEKANAYPSQLSGGQKQRIGIARALANHPELLLCDEATSALDPENTTAILDLLKKINQELGLTIVLITHEMAVIKKMCDSIAVIEDSRIVEVGTIFELFTHPKTITAKRFINSVIKAEPPALLLQNAGRPLIKATFLGEEQKYILLEKIPQKFGLELEIIYGDFDELKGRVFGTLTLKIKNERENLAPILDYLKEEGITAEMID